MKWGEEIVSFGEESCRSTQSSLQEKMQVWPQGPWSTEPVCSHVCAWVLGSIWVGTELWACNLERWGLLWEPKWARPVVVRERTHFL